MEILLELQRMIGINEFWQWIFMSYVYCMIFSYTNIFLFTNLFKVETNRTQKIKVMLLDGTLRLISTLIIPTFYYRAVNIVITITLFKTFFKQSIEKCILGEVINSISIVCVEVIFSKIFCILFPNIETYKSGMYNLKYKFCLLTSISIGRFILCCIVKKKKLTINISNHLNKKHKINIIIISIMGSMIIFFNAVEMTLYISSFPYSIFILDIVSLIIYFYISIRSVMRISELEEKDLKINNLEAYNQTLSIMYDSIRGFRHDYSNFVQALDGYAKTNNIEGIKKMTKSVLKDCSMVNNMGILDPNIIRDPAVYSILTNKYYLANENNVMMNIEVMTNIKDMKIDNYEFCRILGILLDNAIEAAQECEEKVVNIRFIKDSKANRKLVIIENSFNKVDIDIDKIFEKGYSSKEDLGHEHVLGLWTVRKILRKSKNLNLYTTKGKLFSQQLEIYD